MAIVSTVFRLCNLAGLARHSRVISVDTEITEELRAKVVEIANKRPVHRALDDLRATVLPGNLAVPSMPRKRP